MLWFFARTRNVKNAMLACPFCKMPQDPTSTFCRVCGYSLVDLLPRPALARKPLYLGISIISLLLALAACVLTFIPSWYMRSLIPMIASLGLASFTLEKAWGRSDTLAIKILAILALAFALLGYVSFMFIRSNVPGIGYTM
jgi:4-amino-4-deoxy-L-arabinose transferase-like glycosyltransferase